MERQLKREAQEADTVVWQVNCLPPMTPAFHTGAGVSVLAVSILIQLSANVLQNTAADSSSP